MKTALTILTLIILHLTLFSCSNDLPSDQPTQDRIEKDTFEILGKRTCEIRKDSCYCNIVPNKKSIGTELEGTYKGAYWETLTPNLQIRELDSTEHVQGFEYNQVVVKNKRTGELELLYWLEKDGIYNIVPYKAVSKTPKA